MQPTDTAFFNYHLQENVIVPAPSNGKCPAARRLVFSLDGLGIADAAPCAMAAATDNVLHETRIRPEQVRFVVPYQAGTGIVRLTAMKLEEGGIRGEVVNGLTCDVGNVSSCSIPYGLWRTWNCLQGTIVCPTAGVGDPGEANISRGCIVLQTTETHECLCR